MLLVRNAKIIGSDGARDGAILVKGESIVEVGARIDAPEGADVIDARGLYLAPGFIDLHVHGGGGKSAMADDPGEIVQMCNAHARFGTTSILPTTFASPIADIRAAARAIAAAMTRPCDATILGVHMEGPCLSEAQSGAQSVDDLISPDALPLESMLETGVVRMMGAAPELPGGMALGDALSARGVVASVAHSDARYAAVEEATQHGYSDVTHLYSGCSGMIRVNSYRIPGVIEAGLNLDALTAQVIADGKHLPPELLSLIYRCKGADGMYLVTDGLEFAAEPLREGARYRQKNGVEVVLEDGVMKLPSRQAFAGSVATMNRLVRVMRSAGAPLSHAVRMATENPAKRLGLQNKGRLRAGADADFVLFDEDIDVKLVSSMGRIVLENLTVQ